MAVPSCIVRRRAPWGDPRRFESAPRILRLYCQENLRQESQRRKRQKKKLQKIRNPKHEIRNKFKIRNHNSFSTFGFRHSNLSTVWATKSTQKFIERRSSTRGI